MKIYIILLIYFSIIFSAFSNEIDNKGLVCEYSIDSNKPNEYYWFSDGQVYKVWYDKKTKIIKKEKTKKKKTRKKWCWSLFSFCVLGPPALGSSSSTRSE